MISDATRNISEQFEWKKNNRKFNVGSNSCVQKMKNLKKSKAKWNKGNGAFKAKHFQTNQASCGKTRERPGEFPYSKMQQAKVYDNKIQGVGQFKLQ